MYIEIKRDFKILVYFINFLTPGKRVRTHSQEHPHGAHIFTPSNFFINPDECVGNSVVRIRCFSSTGASCINIAYAQNGDRNLRTQCLYMRPSTR